MAGSRWPVTPPGLEQTVRSLVSLRAISEWLHEWLVNGAAVHGARVCTRRALHALPRRQHDGTIRLWRVTEADAVGTWTTAELVYHLRFFSLPLPCLSLSLLILAAWLSASMPLHFLLLSSYYVRRMKTSVNNYSIRPTVHEPSLRRRNFIEVGVSVCLFEATIRRTAYGKIRFVSLLKCRWRRGSRVHPMSLRSFTAATYVSLPTTLTPVAMTKTRNDEDASLRISCTVADYFTMTTLYENVLNASI